MPPAVIASIGPHYNRSLIENIGYQHQIGWWASASVQVSEWGKCTILCLRRPSHWLSFSRRLLVRYDLHEEPDALILLDKVGLASRILPISISKVEHSAGHRHYQGEPSYVHITNDGRKFRALSRVTELCSLGNSTVVKDDMEQ